MTRSAVVACERCGVRVSAPGLDVHRRSPACQMHEPLRPTSFQRACFAALLDVYESAGYHRLDGVRGYASASTVARKVGGVSASPVGRALSKLAAEWRVERDGRTVTLGGPVTTMWMNPEGGVFGMWLGYAPRARHLLAPGALAWVEAEGFAETLARLAGDGGSDDDA